MALRVIQLWLEDVDTIRPPIKAAVVTVVLAVGGLEGLVIPGRHSEGLGEALHSVGQLEQGLVGFGEAGDLEGAPLVGAFLGLADLILLEFIWLISLHYLDVCNIIWQNLVINKHGIILLILAKSCQGVIKVELLQNIILLGLNEGLGFGIPDQWLVVALW